MNLKKTSSNCPVFIFLYGHNFGYKVLAVATIFILFRKREIEQMLANFSCVETAWRDCIYFMDNSNNDYVAMFCLTTLEQVSFNMIVN